jgi:hypothetical protein
MLSYNEQEARQRLTDAPLYQKLRSEKQELQEKRDTEVIAKLTHSEYELAKKA